LAGNYKLKPDSPQAVEVAAIVNRPHKLERLGSGSGQTGHKRTTEQLLTVCPR
jgi:hypothetical protein